MISEGAEALSQAELLDTCDRLLGEVGRRSHLFAWLRPDRPSAGGIPGQERWLVVDAYYPRHRLVVILRDQPQEHDALYDELIPKHGLNLFSISGQELGADRAAVAETLRSRLEKIAPPPPIVIEPSADGERRTRPRPIMQAAAALAQPVPSGRQNPVVSASQAAAVARASRFAAAAGPVVRRVPPPRRPIAARAPRPAPARPRSRGREVEAVGLFLGLCLIGLVAVEMYLDVAKVALGAGLVVLAFGIAIDAVARVLGTVAARRAGRSEWAWACAICGSPAVMAFTLFCDEGPLATDPAPIAGLLSLFACGVIVAGVLGAVL